VRYRGRTKDEILMPLMTGKRAFLELLRQEGVEVIFGNPGTTELPLMDALAVETSPRYVLALQEGAVMAMAGGYAQASGKLTAVNIHVAPGLGNAMGMLYDAQKAGAPILVTAGQHDQSFAITEPILWAELPEIARPFVKWATEVRRLTDLPRLLHRAAKTALAPPTGPVFLSIPGDILNAEAEIDLGRPTRIAPRLRGDAAAIEAAAKLLASAQNPVILAGDGVARSGAITEIVKLAETIGAPAHLEGIDNSTPFPSTHPLFRGPITRLAPQIRKTLAQHDLLLSIGADLFTMSLPSDLEAIPPGLPIIHLDADPWQLGKNYPAEVAILADPKAALSELTEAVAMAMSKTGKSEAERRRIALEAAIAEERAALKARALAEVGKVPIQPLALWQTIGEMLPKDIVVVDETLSSGPGLRQLVAGDDGKSFFGMRGGGIGWGLPAAVGIKLALPDRPVLALIGDGSAMFNCQALWTAAHERLAVVFIILNNGAYRILKQRVNALRGHAAQTGRYIAMDLDDPRIDFTALARSMGVQAKRAATLEEVREALAAALGAEGPTLIDVALDPSFSPI
jgi:benzoylformate decarboxylase